MRQAFLTNIMNIPSQDSRTTGKTITMPKDTPSAGLITDQSPPPYTPPRRPSLASLGPGHGGPEFTTQQRPLLFDETGRLTTRPVHTTIFTGSQEDDASPSMSPLHLRINSSVNISKSNNLVCLVDSPARHASAIAEAVTQAIQRTSAANCGIPMIDGNGDPRPIRIEVDAGIVVDGVGNVVGNEKIVHEVLRQRGELLRRQDPGRPAADGPAGAEEDREECERWERPAKRRRST